MKKIIKNTIRLSCFFMLGFAAHSVSAKTSCSYSSFNEHHSYVGSYNACIRKTLQTVSCAPLKERAQKMNELKKTVFAICGRKTGQLIDSSLKKQRANGQARLNCQRNFGEYIVTKRDDVFEFSLEDKQKNCQKDLEIQKAQANTPRPSNGNGAYLNQGVQ